MRKNTKRTIMVVSLISLLAISGIAIFAQGFLNPVEVSRTDWKIIQPKVDNLYVNLKAMVDTQESKGLLSKYQADGIREVLEDSYKELSKSRDLYLLGGPNVGQKGFKGMRKGQGGFEKGNQPNNKKGQGYPQGKRNGGQYIEMTEEQYNALLPLANKIMDSQDELFKSFVDAGVLTEQQAAMHKERSQEIRSKISESKTIPPFFGVKMFIMLSGIDLSK